MMELKCDNSENAFLLVSYMVSDLDAATKMLFE